MKNTLFALTASLIAALGSLSGASLSWDRVEATVTMEPGQEKAEAIFVATNEGDEPVRIARIKTSCGCTGSMVDQKIIRPGESTEIVASFNKGRRQGLNRNRLSVFVDGENQPVANLIMTVEIPTLIEAQPKIVYWNPASPRQAKRVAIRFNSEFVEGIDRLLYDDSKLVVTLEKNRNGDAEQITLTIEPKTYDEIYRGMIKVMAVGKDGLSPSAPVHVFVQP